MTLSLDPLVPASAIVAGGVALLAAELVPLWRRRRVSRRRALAISVAAILATLAALALLARPAIVREARRPVRGLVLVDASRSMATSDEGGRTRYEAALDAAHRLARDVGEARLSIEPFPEIGRSLPEAPTGDSTAIGDAIGRGLARASSGEPLAAIAVLSDGASNSGRDPVAAAREALGAGVRVFTVAFGTSDPETPPRLVRASIQAPERAALGSTASVRGQVEVEGLEGVPVELELARDGVVVGRATVEGSRSRAIREASFSVSLGQEGLRGLALRARAGPRERRAEARVRVRAGRIGVALVDAPARWEHRYLRRALEDASRIELERVCVWGSRPSAELEAEAIAAVSSADVIVLGEVAPRALSADVGRAIVRAVEDGKGLLVLGGARAFASAVELGLGTILPVTLDADLPTLDRPFRPVETDEGRALFESGLDLGAPEVHELLEHMPQLPNCVALPPLVRGATVLLEAPARRPVAVIGRHGLGRTAVVALGATWHWAFDGNPSSRPSAAQVHAAFLRELATRLAPRDAGLASAVLVESPSSRVARGEPFPVAVRLQGEAAAAEVVRFFLLGEHGETLGEETVSRGTGPGPRASLSLPTTFDAPYAVVRAIALGPKARELARDERILEVEADERAERPGEPCDLALLARIADAGGGSAFASPDMARGEAARALASALDAARPVVRETSPLATGLGHAVLLALLLGATWGLRRGGGLA
jgi:hypothetical protein